MIEAAQRRVAFAANASLTTLHWHVGHKVRTEALENISAEGPGAAGGIQNTGTLVLSDVTLKGNTAPNCNGGIGCPP